MGGKKMDVAEILIELWHNHKGKFIGVVCGLIFSLFVISFGFWKALFIFFCILVGFYLGKKVDSKIDIRKSVEDMFRD